MTDTVAVSREIAAPAELVWGMVSDVTRMGEWSPENEGGSWMGESTSAERGAKFKAANRYGKRSWKTVSTVVAAEPGRLFSFRVSAGPFKVAEWSYDFEPTATGCRVTESWTDLRNGLFRPIAQMATGVKDRAAHNRKGMEQTLENLAQAAESVADTS